MTTRISNLEKMHEASHESAVVRALVANHSLSQADAELLTGREWTRIDEAYACETPPAETAAILAAGFSGCDGCDGNTDDDDAVWVLCKSCSKAYEASMR